jgi:queuine tRNA-ribosyltransferase subunit QTRTD1
MSATQDEKLKSLPGEMFSIIKSTSHHLSPRLGSLAIPGRNAIQTPHYLGLTSRGAIPHISQDNFAQLSAIAGVYAALEDCKFLQLYLRPRRCADTYS